MIDLRAALGPLVFEPKPAPKQAPPPEELPQLDPEQARRALFTIWRPRAMRSFRFFVALFWPVLHQGKQMLPSVAVDVMSDALQSTVEEDGARKLLIGCPPGVSKSLLCSVFYPAWLLYRTQGQARIMVGSYAWGLAERDSVKCRDIVKSELYEALIDGAWTLRTDRNAVDDWWTTTGGRRLITSIDGKALGERVDYQIMDDPMHPQGKYSESMRVESVRWVTEVLPSRLDDQKNAVRVVVMQRLGMHDPIGELLAGDPDGKEWAYCRLPAWLAEGEAPSERRSTTTGRLLWRDPRAPGVPLFEQLDAAALAILRASGFTSSRLACEYFQNPVDDDNAKIRRTWWRFYRPTHASDKAPRPAGCDEKVPAVEQPERCERVVIACDLTFGSQKGDYCAIQAWGAKGAGRYLLGLWRKRAGLLESVATIKSFARRWPSAKIIVEAAANGRGACEELAVNGVPNVIAVPPLGSKKERIGLVAATIESGCAFLPLGDPQITEFVEELAGATKHDDQQDAAAYAIHELNKDCAIEWPEVRAERERLEAASRGEQVVEPPTIAAKLNALWRNTPLPGKPRDVATGQVVRECQHEWLEGTCRLCGK